MELQIKLIGGKMPVRGTPSSAGLDLFSSENKIINCGHTAIVKTGVCMKIPDGYYGKIESRSSYACKGLVCAGGIIDSDYTGEIMVIMHNGGGSSHSVTKSDKICQMIIMKCEFPKLVEVDSLAKTQRGDKGFGSTGF